MTGVTNSAAGYTCYSDADLCCGFFHADESAARRCQHRAKIRNEERATRPVESRAEIAELPIKPEQKRIVEDLFKRGKGKPSSKPSTVVPSPSASTVTDVSAKPQTPEEAAAEKRILDAIRPVLEQRLADIPERLRETAEQVAKGCADTELGKVQAQIATEVEKAAAIHADTLRAELIDTLKQSREVVITINDEDPVVVTGVVHHAFEEVLTLAKLGVNLFLVGPTGAGKTHLVAQLAEALKAERFGTISLSEGVMEYMLTGRRLPDGNESVSFVTTDFLECFENGGVFLFDEVDGSDPNTLCILNQALANGRVPVPSRHERPIALRHENFVAICAANTYGRGADRMYVGRNQLDAAFLDRFTAGTITVDYDVHLESEITRDPEWVAYCTRVRTVLEDNRMRRVLSTRFVLESSRLIAAGVWDYEKARNRLIEPWTEDERKRVTSLALPRVRDAVTAPRKMTRAESLEKARQARALKREKEKEADAAARKAAALRAAEKG